MLKQRHIIPCRLAKKSIEMRLTIILVAPARAENIGAAARAMKTMGFTQLRIVDSEAHLVPATRWVAHGSGDIIDNISVFSTLAEALYDVDFTVATTARSRAKFHYYATPVELVPLLRKNQRGWITPRWYLVVKIQG